MKFDKSLVENISDFNSDCDEVIKIVEEKRILGNEIINMMKENEWKYGQVMYSDYIIIELYDYDNLKKMIRFLKEKLNISMQAVGCGFPGSNDINPEDIEKENPSVLFYYRGGRISLRYQVDYDKIPKQLIDMSSGKCRVVKEDRSEQRLTIICKKILDK